MKRFACCMTLLAALVSGCAQTRFQSRSESPLTSEVVARKPASETSTESSQRSTENVNDSVVHADGQRSLSSAVQQAGAQGTAEPSPLPPAPAAQIDDSETSLPQPSTLTPQPVLNSGHSTLDSPATLDAFEQLALQNNPTLRMAEAEIEKERGNWTQVGLYPNPTVGYLRSDAASSGGGRSDGAFVQQTFITGGKLTLNREIEVFGIADVAFQQEAQRQRVLNDVRQRFYAALSVQEELKLADEIVALTREGVTASQRQFDAGEVPVSDVLQSEIQLQVFESSRDRARSNYRLAWQNLVDMVGIPDRVPEELAGDFPKEFAELDRDALWQQLVETSGLLRSSEAQVGVARKTLERQEVQPIPDVTVQVVGEVDHTNGASTVSTLLALPLPLFDRNQGNIYNAWHDAARAEQEVERTRLVLRDQFALTYRDYETARNESQRLASHILPRTKRNLELVTTGYQQGQFDLPRVLSARQTYFEMTMNWLTARSQAQHARMQLEGLLLTGGLNPAIIGTAIQGADEGGDQRRGVLQNLQQQQGARLQLFNPGTTQ
ncbi:MAG: TolC family protein [Rhodopirellula sp.]|nr:TolC family protein [Rhodopirellula sp.]